MTYAVVTTVQEASSFDIVLYIYIYIALDCKQSDGGITCCVSSADVRRPQRRNNTFNNSVLPAIQLLQH